MFRRFFDEGLAQSSYVLACARTRQAAIIDPRRDIDEYVETAAEHGLTITHAIETHIHADFVSGARELGEIGAVAVCGPRAGLGFAHHETRDGETLSIGDVKLTCLHTPGHTPEHICIVAEQPDAPVRAFTGDTLFVGAVGRPDLLGKAATDRLASDLYDSLFSKLLSLPDDVEVHPAHGAGSLCGAGIGNAPHSTIGGERRFNPFLQHRTRASFVSGVLGDLPETPPYFARMKAINREGPALLGLSQGVAPPAAVTAEEAARAMDEGAWLLDVRSSAVHADAHPAGAINMAVGPKLGYWAGWIVPADARIVLMLDGGARHAADVRRQLIRVGLDVTGGWIQGGFDAWRAAALPVRRTRQLPAAELTQHQRSADVVTLVDVRSVREWQAGHIAGALHIPLPELVTRLSELHRRRPVATVCEGGYRSSLAASLLERHGIADVMNVAGGMTAWRAVAAAR